MEKRNVPLSPSDTIVCVTGIAGFVSSHVTKLLLSEGFQVRGTVRSLKNKSRFSHLYDIEKEYPNSKLSFYEADLSQENAFDEVVKGCHYVLHIASPIAFLTKDPMRDVIQPAIDGTLNVLASCSKSGTVKKVVLTSSIWAVTSWCEDRGKNYQFTEKDWNTFASVKYNSYAFSKKAAEEAAWNYVKTKKDFELTTIIPGAILGPVLGKDPSLPAPLQLIKSIMTGQLITIPNLPLYLVDVRDVAKAHILAMKNPISSGKRYICKPSEDFWISHVAKILKKEYPNYPIISTPLPNFFFNLIPTFLARLNEPILYGKQNTGLWFNFDNSKIKRELGLEFFDIEQSVKDCAKSLIENGYVPKKMLFGSINIRLMGIIIVFITIILLVKVLFF